MTLLDGHSLSPADEKEEVKNLIEQGDARRQEGDIYYIVAARWWQQWTEYVDYTDAKKTTSDVYLSSGFLLSPLSNTSLRKPLPIDNHAIVQFTSTLHDEAHLKRSLREEEDFVLIPQVAWIRLHQLYGGGPAVPRKLIAQGEGSRRELVVEVYPLVVQIVRASTGSRGVREGHVSISKRAKVDELQQKVATLLNVDYDGIRLWDFFGSEKTKMLTDTEQALEDAQILDGQSILVEERVEGRWIEAEKVASSSVTFSSSLNSGLTSASSSLDTIFTIRGSVSTFPPRSTCLYLTDKAESELVSEMGGESKLPPLVSSCSSASCSSIVAASARTEQLQVPSSVHSNGVGLTSRGAAALESWGSGSLSPLSSGFAASMRDGKAFHQHVANGSSSLVDSPPVCGRDVGDASAVGNGSSSSSCSISKGGVLGRLGWRDGGGRGGGGGGGTSGRGLTGLQNLGNTCFMNSALQCLAHTPQLVSFFLANYTREINLENPLGMKGEIARAFGELLREMCSVAKSPVPPRHFKVTLARFAPQFSGYNQHDSQELLAFLLNGLHEDLNRVRDKPYIEQRDGDGRPDEEVARESWANHRARNDSVVVDICQGQYKSTLVCPVCGKTSITFDPFMYLSLPLPAKTMRSMMVAVFTTSDTVVSPETYTVTVSKHGMVSDLADAVAKACDLTMEERLVLIQLQMGRTVRYLDVSSMEAVSAIKDEEPLVAYRVPCCIQRSRLMMVLNKREDGLRELKMFGAPLVGIAPEEGVSSARDVLRIVKAVLRPMRKRRQVENGLARARKGEKEDGVTEEEEKSMGNDRNGYAVGESVRSCNGLVRSAAGSREDRSRDGSIAVSMEEDAKYYVRVEGELPIESGALAAADVTANEEMNMRETCRGGASGAEGDGLAEMDEDTDNDGGYDGGASSLDGVRGELEITEVVDDIGSIAEEGDLAVAADEEEERAEAERLPFQVFCTDDKGLTKDGRLELGTPLPRSWMTGGMWRSLCLEWRTGEWEEDYELGVMERVVELIRAGGPSLAKKARQEPVSLYACMEAFLSKESLGKDDMWYCPRCKEHRQATKKLDLWRLPDILVVHLKRFSYSHWWKKKLETFVDFPLRGFDVTQYVTRKKNGKSQENCVYDLYAVSNHYGGMGGGHYTAYAKLVNDDTWHNFDDSHVSPIREDEVKSSAGYMLFYKKVRQDEKVDEEYDDEDEGEEDGVDVSQSDGDVGEGGAGDEEEEAGVRTPRTESSPRDSSNPIEGEEEGQDERKRLEDTVDGHFRTGVVER